MAQDQFLIIILDFGSQYTQLIARRVREQGVYCEIHTLDVSYDEVMGYNPQGIVLSGGPESVTSEESLRAPDFVFTLGIPVLGICYGMQTMAQQLGGKVAAAEKNEFGHAEIIIAGESILFHGLAELDGQDSMPVWMSHGDQVVSVPRGFNVLARTETCPIAACLLYTSPSPRDRG